MTNRRWVGIALLGLCVTVAAATYPLQRSAKVPETRQRQRDALAFLGELTVKKPVQKPRLALVRGYLAASLERRADKRDVTPYFTADDVFLPGKKVLLHNLLTGEKSQPVVTDLSGRFTFPPQGPGRYRVCWNDTSLGQGCSSSIFSVQGEPVHVGTVRVALWGQRRVLPETTVIYGSVTLADGSAPRKLAPLANINAFAQVSLLDGGGRRINEVYVNNFGEYLIPRVPVDRPLVLRARIEGAVFDQRINPAANLDGAPLHRIDLVIPNHPPSVDPLVATDAEGARVRVAVPGSTVHLAARTSDRDRDDAVRFKWFVEAGSGSLNDTVAEKVQWTLPKASGLYRVTLFAYDGRGGYGESSLMLLTGERGLQFAGRVDGTDTPAVRGAIVEVNGHTTVTGADGRFSMRIPDAERFVLNIRATGYGLVSQIYDDAVIGGQWTLTRASVTRVDPTLQIVVTEQRDRRNCPGPRALRLDWRLYDHLAEPQWQDGKGNVVQPHRNLEIDFGRVRRQREQEGCGPGISIKIPANSLVDERGNPPAGMVDISLCSIDLMSPEQMPGDYTVRLSENETAVMQSYGAATIGVTSGDTTYSLRKGAVAEIEFPVDRSQLLAGGVLPSTIPLLYYDERDGVWFQDGDAVLQGSVYIAKVKHFSTINTDLVKTDQACVRILSPSLPDSYKLEVYIPLGSGAAPKLISKVIDNASPSEHVIYNLPTDTNIVLVPIRLDTDIPFGMFVVNTGGEQFPTSPNLPEGPPYDACSTEVILTDLAVPDEPTSGEFLHGLYSFSATNLDELDPADPTDTALADALDQATIDYYLQIDPRGKRLTLDGFTTTNGFGGPEEVSAVFANSGDLGFGRDMHMVRIGDDVAAYVTNYGNIKTADSADVINAALRNGPVATVAMEYSRIESPPGNAVEFDDPERVVKFYVYNADGSNLLRSANLDELGARPIPQLCMVCHGGEYPGGPVFGPAPAFASRNDVKLGSSFLPFDLSLYTFGPSPTPFDKPTQQSFFKAFNEDHVNNTNPNAAIADVIVAMYASGSDQDEDFVVTGWDVDALHRDMYRSVIADACRTCHQSNVFASLRFDQASQVITRLGSIENRVCDQLVMPHAKVTHQIFWNSTNPHKPAQLQVFGDTLGDPVNNGWFGELCGQFTPGGETPSSFYTTNIQPIWQARCVECHVGAAPPGGLSLASAVSYGNLVGVNASQPIPPMNRVTPFDLINSYLYHKLIGDHADFGGIGARMPADGGIAGYLTAAQMADIESWVLGGADP